MIAAVYALLAIFTWTFFCHTVDIVEHSWKVTFEHHVSKSEIKNGFHFALVETTPWDQRIRFNFSCKYSSWTILVWISRLLIFGKYFHKRHTVFRRLWLRISSASEVIRSRTVWRDHSGSLSQSSTETFSYILFMIGLSRSEIVSLALFSWRIMF